MSWIQASLYKHPSNRTLDPEAAISIARERFPEAIFFAGDQLERSWRLAAEHLELSRHSARSVVRSLRRKAEQYGPAYAFRIAGPSDSETLGVVRPVDISFTGRARIPALLRERIVSFIQEVFPRDLRVEIYEAETKTRRVIGYTGAANNEGTEGPEES